MRRVSDNRYGYRSWSEEDLKRYGKFLLLPLAVLILVIVILVADRKNRPQTEETATEESSLQEEPAADPSQGTEGGEETDSGFAIGEVPQVRELIDQYFTAKQAADAETIYRLFGWDDLTGIDDLRRLLQYDARYTDGYRNIVCYTRQGLTEDSYLVYVSYDLKFKNSLTLAPGLQWNYIKTKEDGSLYLTDGESLSTAELELAAKAERTDEIMLLRTQVYARLRQALEDDPSLAESYSILERQGGAAGNGQAEERHEAEVQIGTGQAGQGTQIQIGQDAGAAGPDGEGGDGAGTEQTGQGEGSPEAGEPGDAAGAAPGAEGQDGAGTVAAPGADSQSGAGDGSSSAADGQDGAGTGSPAAGGQDGTGNGSPAAGGQDGTGAGSPAAGGQDSAGAGPSAAEGQSGAEVRIVP